MKRSDYILYAIQNKFVHKHKWFYTFFTILNNFTENEYLKLENNKFYVKVNGSTEELEGGNFSNVAPIYVITEPIKVSKGFLPNITEDMNTTIGRLILNHIAISNNFGDKVPYMNKEIDPSTVEKTITPLIMNDTISIKEYLNFVDSVYYLCGLGRIFNLSATPKTVVPPAGINKFKKEVKAEFDKKYGKEWTKDRTRMIEFQDKLKTLDKEWLKDDPTNGKLLGSKIKDNARVKMFLTIGPEVGFDKKSGKATMIENSLMESFPEGREELAAIFNSSRAGSFDRGHETQKGGAVAKSILRASSSIVIEDKDCGTKLGKEVYVGADNFNSFKGRYYLKDGRTVKIEEPEKLIGKTILLRSPMYCNTPGANFCAICLGEGMSMNKNGISAELLDISKTLILSALKSMHNSMLKTTNINISEMIK